MVQKWGIGFLTVMLLAGCSVLEDTPEDRPYRWAAYYDYEKNGDDFADYDLVVLDSTHFPPLEPIKENGTKVYGYLSLGEVRGDEPVYELAKERGIILDKNPDWASHIVDLRSPWWHRYILEFAIPALIKDGFDGVMLDTVESPVYMLEMDKEQERKMRLGANSIIIAARQRFPSFQIMLNRGFSLLPDVAGHIDGVLAESILAVPDEENKGQFRLLRDSYYQSIVTMLHNIQEKHPHLDVYTLDYWQMDDRRGIQKLYKKQRDQGFRPYISTPDLRKLYLEPVQEKE